MVHARPDTWLPTIEEIGAAPAELWLGSPVYCKTINIGVLPNSSYAEIPHNLSATHIVRVEGVTNYGSTIPYVYATNRIELGCSKTNIYVTTTADYSYMQAYITIYYTKD
jgi:hypothetical protein